MKLLSFFPLLLCTGAVLGQADPLKSPACQQALAALDRARLPPPPVEVGRPPGPVLCDAGGCWAEDAGRLRHLGPGQGIPGGPCGPPGALVYCP